MGLVPRLHLMNKQINPFQRFLIWGFGISFLIVAVLHSIELAKRLGFL